MITIVKIPTGPAPTPRKIDVTNSIVQIDGTITKNGTFIRDKNILVRACLADSNSFLENLSAESY